MELTRLVKGGAIPIHVSPEPTTALAAYAGVSIAFEVDRVLDVAPAVDPGDGFILSERVLGASYIKDYDALESPEEWPRRFDLSKWGLLVARVDGQRVGGAVVAFDTPDVMMLLGHTDLAVLWDIRVAAEFRALGVGSALFREAESWARVRGCRRLRIETQNINAPACRFYARQGCTLESVDPFAYPDLPNEVQLIWSKDL